MARSSAEGSDTTPGVGPGQGQETRRVDVAIAGGGLVGLALALALARGSSGGLSVLVIDPSGGAAPPDGRASAIAAGARRMLETLGGWPTDLDATQPILDMIVTDGRIEDGVRPTILSFGGEAEPGEPFAHMVENATLIAALASAALGSGVTIHRSSVAERESGGPRTTLRLADGSTVAASLVAACDGARSSLREQAGIAMVGWDYGQAGIVTTIAHERPHQGRAEEHFLPAGPFAILPLPDADGRHRSSLVWTEKTTEAERLVAAPDAEFLAALIERIGHHLGEIALAGPRRAFPLGLKFARSFIAERLALVGDAAHIIHPIAGQGLNMGYRDVAALAEVVIDAFRLGEDIGELHVLERYQRWRRFDTTVMGATTDGLNRLFSNDSDVLRGIRDFGLGVVDRMPGLKKFFVRSAAGLAGELPKLLQGRMV